MNKIDYVFYPPVGIAYVTKDLSDLIKYKLHNKKRLLLIHHHNLIVYLI